MLALAEAAVTLGMPLLSLDTQALSICGVKEMLGRIVDCGTCRWLSLLLKSAMLEM